MAVEPQGAACILLPAFSACEQCKADKNACLQLNVCTPSTNISEAKELCSSNRLSSELSEHHKGNRLKYL